MSCYIALGVKYMKSAESDITREIIAFTLKLQCNVV